MVTDKQRANLVPFPKGTSGNPKGRGPSWRSLFKKLPRDVQTKVAEVLWTALSMSSTEEASKYMAAKAEELPECGFMLQVLLRGLNGKDGAWVLGSILDRLLGRPRQQAEIKHTGSAGVQVVVNDSQTADAVKAVLENAAQGRVPEVAADEDGLEEEAN